MRLLAGDVESALGTDLLTKNAFSRFWTFAEQSNKSGQTALLGSFPVRRVYRSVSTAATGCRRNYRVRFLGKRRILPFTTVSKDSEAHPSSDAMGIGTDCFV
jgi:hypothetical protein